ncbi:unnamed protein product [Orchesella dallaii]|uniref:Reverse transcriptase domain-containing protein n=1 Tax=Orchesella dallaii TaxID=48710 RepID=A0ABP1S419_9HEXA
MYRKDAKCSKERGIVILVANHLKYWKFDLETCTNNTEIAVIKIQYKYMKSIIIGCVYRHPNYRMNVLQSDIDMLGNLFTKMNNSGNEFLILGDFNLKDNYINPLLSYCDILDIKQIVNVPTRADKLLDLIFVKVYDNISNTNIYDAALADHLLTECRYSYNHKRSTYKMSTFRVFSKDNTDNFINSLNMAFSDYRGKTFDEFIETFFSILNKNLPLRSKTYKEKNQKKHISSKTKRLIRVGKKLYNIQKRAPTFPNKEKFKKTKKQINHNILADTKHELSNNIHKCGLWRGLKKNVQLKGKPQGLSNLDPNSINDFYVNISTVDPNDEVKIQDKPPSINPENKSFTLSSFTTNDIILAWKMLKNHDSKSLDPLGISNFIIKYAMKSVGFVKALTDLFNCFKETGYIPDTLKMARIVPVAKCKDPTSPNQTRPISIQTIFTKLLDKCIYKQLSEYFEKNNLFTNRQFGFRKKLTTSHALIALTDFLYEKLDEGNVCAVLALDLQKAFDSVNRDILVNKLLWYGIDCKIINELIFNRSQYVEVNNKKSSIKYTTKGIQQGAATSSLYFSIYINDLPNCIQSCESFLFADDTSLANSCKVDDLPVMVKEIEKDLVHVNEWLNNNHVKLNVDKTQLLFVCKPQLKHAVSNVDICLNNKKIEKVQTLKILGVLLDTNLNFSDHCKHVCKKSYKSLSMIYPLKNVLSIENKVTLINAFIFSVLSYASIIWMNNLNNACMSMIDKVIKAAARYVLNKRKYDSLTKNICSDLEWLFSKGKYVLECLKMTYMFTYTSQCGYFNNYLDFSYTTVQKTRNNVYRKPATSPKTIWGERSFKYRAVNMWLQLPNFITSYNTSSINNFKKAVLAYLLTKQSDELIIEYNDTSLMNFSCIDHVVNRVLI